MPIRMGLCADLAPRFQRKIEAVDYENHGAAVDWVRDPFADCEANPSRVSQVPGRTPKTRLRFAAALAVGVLLLTWASRSVNSIDNDFFNFWAGSRIGPAHLYEPQRFHRIADSLGAKVIEARFFYARMPYYAVLTKPLGWLPFKTARVLWVAVQILGLLVVPWLWLGRRLALLLLISLAAAFSVVIGTDTALLLAFVAASSLLLQRRRSLLAGLVFSLCLIKPHLVLFVPLVLLPRRDWRFFMGTAAGASLQIGASYAAAGVLWPSQWLSIILNPATHPYEFAMPGVRAYTHSPFGWVLIVSLILVFGLSVWRTAKTGDLPKALALALAAGLVGNVHSYLVDSILVLPAVAITLKSPSWPLRTVAVFLASPVPYLLLLAGQPVWLQGSIVAVLSGSLVLRKARMNSLGSTFIQYS